MMVTSTVNEQKPALKRLAPVSSLPQDALDLLVSKASLQRLHSNKRSHHACGESDILKSSMHACIPKAALFNPPLRVRTGPPLFNPPKRVRVEPPSSKSSVEVVRACFKSIAAGAAPCTHSILPEFVGNTAFCSWNCSHCQTCGTILCKSLSVCQACLPACPPAPLRIGIDCPP